jgi:hypothetical protein
MISGTRASSIVTDTLTSEVVTTSTGVLNCSKTSDPPQEPVRHQHARGLNIDDRDAFFDATAVMDPRPWGVPS